ncbi:MAG TPA: hypothetical protein VNO55_00740 [Polyangia bacterium]|nr:hypothetical protein [Polyangia bacterium]
MTLVHRSAALGLLASLWGCAAAGPSASPDAQPDAAPPSDTGGPAQPDAAGHTDTADTADTGGTGGTTGTTDAAPPDSAMQPDATALPETGAPDRPPAPDAPPQVVGTCAALGPVGTWQEITPPAVKTGLASRMPSDAGGTFSFAVDPVNSGTVYAGTVYQKMWKSTDCGATWTQLGTGRNAGAWDHAMNWTFAVDPQQPNVVYTNSGYGTMGNGLLKSTNGGVDWDIVWPPALQPDLGKHFMYNFANVVTIDPADHLHLILTFHESCIGMPGVSTCIAESSDAGATWKLLPGDPSWNGNEGQLFYFLENARTWIWASQTNGFFRTDTAGATWAALKDDKGKGFFPSHLQGAGLYRAKNGFFYVAAGDGIFRSPDGKTWTLAANTGPIGGGIASDGTTIFASRCFFGGFCAAGTQVFLSTPETDGVNWTILPDGPRIAMGGEMHYDSGHHLMYASTFGQGFWRMVTK